MAARSLPLHVVPATFFVLNQRASIENPKRAFVVGVEMSIRKAEVIMKPVAARLLGIFVLAAIVFGVASAPASADVVRWHLPG